ncbi:hypothetical protein DsansV1_C07g0075731 [Dioscorea sansibarensis]
MLYTKSVTSLIALFYKEIICYLLLYRDSAFLSVVGELDEELDSSLDLSKLRAHPLKQVIH